MQSLRVNLFCSEMQSCNSKKNAERQADAVAARAHAELTQADGVYQRFHQDATTHSLQQKSPIKLCLNKRNSSGTAIWNCRRKQDKNALMHKII